MKIGELINKLNEEQAQHGDLEIIVADVEGEAGRDLNGLEADYQHRGRIYDRGDDSCPSSAHLKMVLFPGPK